jgi:hypothetical protein
MAATATGVTPVLTAATNSAPAPPLSRAGTLPHQDAGQPATSREEVYPLGRAVGSRPGSVAGEHPSRRTPPSVAGPWVTGGGHMYLARDQRSLPSGPRLLTRACTETAHDDGLALLRPWVRILARRLGGPGLPNAESRPLKPTRRLGHPRAWCNAAAVRFGQVEADTCDTHGGLRPPRALRPWGRLMCALQSAGSPQDVRRQPPDANCPSPRTCRSAPSSTSNHR